MTNVKQIEAPELPIQRMMTTLLRWITVAAGMVILTGGVLLLLRHAGAPTAFHTFMGEQASLRSVPQIVTGAFHGHALAIVQFGILLLITTPVLRVLFVGIGYVLERDWLYVAVAGIVLAVLGSSLLGHKL
jgi:uncharacterized membrane protein